MNIHKVIIEDTPDLMKKFFDTITRIEEKIDRGEDYTIEKKRLTNDYRKATGGIFDRESHR